MQDKLLPYVRKVVEDLRKAVVYLKWLLETATDAREGKSERFTDRSDSDTKQRTTLD